MKIKELSWWAFYILFFLVVLFLLFLLVRAFFGGALGQISNAGQLIYFIGLVMVVFGMMAMAIVYVTRVIVYKVRAIRNRQEEEDDF